MLADIRLWRRYPLLLLIRLAQNTIRTTALLFFIMVISIITTSQKIANLPVGFIAVSLGLNWVLMLYFGARLGRYKIMLYPLMFVLNPFFTWLYMVYGIFTAGQRTWGGPRADAGKADEKTTPGQAIEKAVAQGDELNVVPETFRPALDAARYRMPHQAPLMPSGHLEGKFKAAQEVAGGWFVQTNDSGVLHPDMAPRRVEEGPMYIRSPRRDTWNSSHSSSSTANSLYTPRRVESIFGPGDAVAYHDRQGQQRPAGGAHFEIRTTEPLAPSFGVGQVGEKNDYAESIRSFESGSSVSLHFSVPSRPPIEFTSPGGTSQPRGRSSRPSDAPAAQHQHTRSAESHLAPPDPTHQRIGRFTHHTQLSLTRTGRSPLARKSFTRLATDDANSRTVGNVDSSNRLSRRHSIAGERRRGRRSISVDVHGRRRLSEQRRAASQD